MTSGELFKKITSEPKWYAGFTTAQHACLLKKRFTAGTLQTETLRRIFAHFGYELRDEWVAREKTD